LNQLPKQSLPRSKHDDSFSPGLNGEGEVWKAVFEKGPTPGLVCAKDDLTILAANEAATEAYGYTQDEFRRLTLRDLGYPAEEPLAEAKRLPQKHRRKGGGVLHVEVTAHLILFQKQQAWLIQALDVSERRELESCFLRSQRLECVGMMASGMAHDLNNVLSPIMMSASVLRDDLTRSALQEYVAVIEQSARQAISLVRQVLLFVRGAEDEFVTLWLEPIIREVTAMARQTFPKRIAIESDLPGQPLWEIRGDATKIHQVLLNLAVNARDAMEGGGTLRIAARNRELTDIMAEKIGGIDAGRYVEVAVHDNGVGMTEEIQRKIFTPFFSTKAARKGTGLGLVTVRGIMKNHGGAVQVESAPAEGSTFRLYFPACPVREEELTVREEPPPARHEDKAGAGTILVVDDEPGIRKLVETILKRAGYNVVAVGSGTEAMAEYLARPGEIRLILADLHMPVMDGVVLSRAIKAIDPGVEIIISSGMESSQRPEELKALGVTRFLRKPYQALELLAAIGQA